MIGYKTSSRVNGFMTIYALSEAKGMFIIMTLNQNRKGKIVAVMNMTLDGFCDHTVMNADDELHHHYSDLLKNSDSILYGRITYQLMEYWKTILKHPSGNQSMDEFAVVIDNIPKIVFSHTIDHVEWKTAKLAKGKIEEVVLELKQQVDGSILVGSPSLIISLTNLNLIDEYQLCIHPIVVGNGLPLFKNITNRVDLSLTKTKVFGSGAIVLYYQKK